MKWCAGTGILLNKHLASKIHTIGIISEERTQFVIIMIDSPILITLINIYVPIVSREKIELWERITDADLLEDGFVMGGDFNMTEYKEDRLRSSMKSTAPNRREKLAWSRLLNHLKLEDTWSSDGIRKCTDKSFMWDNNRSEEAY